MMQHKLMSRIYKKSRAVNNIIKWDKLDVNFIESLLDGGRSLEGKCICQIRRSLDTEVGPPQIAHKLVDQKHQLVFGLD